MSTNEKLGTCPTCGSASKSRRLYYGGSERLLGTGKWLGATGCTDTWHDGEQPAQGEPSLKLPTKDDPGDLAKFLPSQPSAGEKPHGPVGEQFMKSHYGPSGYVPKRVGLESIAVEGIWLRRIGDSVEVLVEIDRKWRKIISEHFDGPFSHICEPEGIAHAKPE